MEREIPLYCPGCRDDTAIQKVSAIVGAGTSTGAYTGGGQGVGYTFGHGGGITVTQNQMTLAGGSQTLLAQRLSLPPRPTPASGVTPGDILAALGGIGGGGFFVYLALSVGANLPIDADTANYVVAWAVGIVGAIIATLCVLALYWMYLRRQRAIARYNRTTPLWNRAAAIWVHLFYCHRCDGIFLPGEQVLYPPEVVQGYLKNVDVVPDYVTYAQDSAAVS